MALAGALRTLFAKKQISGEGIAKNYKNCPFDI
jgi:hypothetical protein